MELWEAAAVLAVSAAVGAAAGLAASRLYFRRLLRGLSLIYMAASKERMVVRALRRASRRPKKRYIVFEAVSEEPLDVRRLEEGLRREFARLFGEAALSASGLRIVDYDEELGRGIVRVRREYKLYALAAMGALRRVDGVRVSLTPIAVSGTLKRARRRLKSP